MRIRTFGPTGRATHRGADESRSKRNRTVDFVFILIIVALLVTTLWLASAVSRLRGGE